MDESEVARAISRAGYTVHLHEGVWWQKVMPLYCKPVDPLRALPPRSKAPAMRYSLLGYSHRVEMPSEATREWSIMLLPEQRLRNFSMEQLKLGRRTSVRKALRQVEIRRIEDIRPCLDHMNKISASTAQRTGHGASPDYYVNKRDEWAQFMLREFSIYGREWWGAFTENTLIAYYYAYQIADSMYISAAKSDSEYLKLRPNDALAFSFLDYCRSSTTAKQVIYGDWSPDAPQLNEFKQQFGFVRVDVPIYRHERVSFRYLARLARVAKR